MDPISYLRATVTDPVELVGITVPSAALVVGVYAYREQIHSDLQHLPDLNTALGAVIFVVVTLLVSVVIKWLSHHVMNWTYDKIAWPLKLRFGKNNTWFDRANNADFLTKDPKRAPFEDALRQLNQLQHPVPVLSEITLLQVQSKLVRSLAVVLIISAAVLGIYRSIWAAYLLCIALFVSKIFCDLRWEASEKAYGALCDALSPRLKSSRPPSPEE